MLMVVGLNHRGAPLAMRERFWISENRRYEALRQLRSAEGVEEVLILSTFCRTEFLLWANEPTLAANSLVHYLSTEHGLKLSEWEHFSRQLDEGALTHLFRFACGLDSSRFCESEVACQLEQAWEQARTVSAVGPYLNAVLGKTLSVSKRVREETAIGKLAIPLPAAVLDLVGRIFGTLEGRKVLLLGAGRVSGNSARMLADSGAASVMVIDQSPARAQELAQQLGGTAATLADRWQGVLGADIVISASGCPHVILTREETERIATERNRVPLVILDIGMPRDIDPEVRRVDGVLLYDLESLERTVKNHTGERAAAAAEAEKIIVAEAQAFRSKLEAERGVPTSVGLCRRLDEICRQELESFIQERGPFTREQDQLLRAITSKVTQRIAISLGHEIKGLSEKDEQEEMAAVVARLFHLDSPQQSFARNKKGKEKDEPKGRAIAINY
jgi:glutamyl-tRNA reductase